MSVAEACRWEQLPFTPDSPPAVQEGTQGRSYCNVVVRCYLPLEFVYGLKLDQAKMLTMDERSYIYFIYLNATTLWCFCTTADGFRVILGSKQGYCVPIRCSQFEMLCVSLL